MGEVAGVRSQIQQWEVTEMRSHVQQSGRSGPKGDAGEAGAVRWEEAGAESHRNLEPGWLSRVCILCIYFFLF